MQDRTSKFTDRLTPAVKAALVFGLIAGVAVGVLSGVVLNVAAGILIGVLVLIAVVGVASLAIEEKPDTETLPNMPVLDNTLVIEPVESDETAPEQQQT